MNKMNRQTRHPTFMFQDIVENEYDGADEYEGDSIPNYCVEVPRILLTPTRVAVHGFDVEMSNRVIRKFVTEDGVPPERFLRVTVADENGDKLMSDDLGLLVESRMTNISTGVDITSWPTRQVS
jgi:hypothetical protein